MRDTQRMYWLSWKWMQSVCVCVCVLLMGFDILDLVSPETREKNHALQKFSWNREFLVPKGTMFGTSALVQVELLAEIQMENWCQWQNKSRSK